MSEVRCIAAAMAALVLAAAGRAAGDVPNVRDPVAGHPGVTYRDLLRQAIPGLAENPADKNVEGHLAELRHLGGADLAADPPDPVTVDLVEDVRFKAGGRQLIAILADLGQADDSARGTAMLAVFDDSPKPKLLDAADVALDMNTSFDRIAKLPLAAGDDALITYSEHFNSNQSYQARLLALVRGGKLQLVGVQNTFNDHICSYERTEVPTFAVRPDPGQPYGRIDVTVVERLKRTGATCGEEKPPRPYARTWRGGWRWNAAKRRYDDQGGGDLDRLDKLNEARF
jgi:hypothetical protein